MENTEWLRFILALFFVVGLIGLSPYLFRRFGLDKHFAAVTPTRGRKRLSVVEVAALDPKRRLVLIRRDHVEHLVLLGVTSELLIEQGITPPEAAGATEEKGR